MMSVKLFPSATDAGTGAIEIDFTNDEMKALLDAGAARVGSYVFRDFDGDGNRRRVRPLTRTNREKLLEAIAEAADTALLAAMRDAMAFAGVSADSVSVKRGGLAESTPIAAFARAIADDRYKYLLWIG